jgi:ABC-2 type transport system ATP-binding protein
MIRFDRVGRAFGSKWAVKDLSLDVPQGEVFGLLGPNGAGKTTAIRMMTGILEPTEGAITVAGHDIVKEPIEAKSVIGYVPDRAFLYEKLTVREFLSFVSSVYGLDRRTAGGRIEKLSEKFGIKDIEDAYIEGCSQGMRQRVLFAAALIHEPMVLVFDEPIVGLDPFGVELVKELVRELSASGTTVFLATHILAIAADLCQRVGLIDRGKLIALKGSEEVASHEGGLEGLFMKELGGRGNE